MARFRVASVTMVVIASVMMCVFSGCAPADQPLADGPGWSAEFAQARDTATSDLQRVVLSDDTITEQELAAVQDAFRDCLEADGFSDVSFTPDGGYGLVPPPALDQDAINAHVTECERATVGSIFQLWNATTRNPTNVDESQLMARCLVKQGLVPGGYSAADYAAEMQNGALSFDAEDPRFAVCASDPLSVE